MSKLVQAGVLFDKRRQGLYTDLDTLYDTRLAAVEEVDVSWALNLVVSGWKTRLYDKAYPIPDDKYEELYQLRDVKTLLHATPTLAIDGILAWCLQVQNAMQGTPYEGFVEVFVNVWPYKLTKQQAQKYAEGVIKILGEDTAKVTLLNIDPKDITALDAKTLFSGMFMSDWCYWLEERAKSGDIKNTPLPDVTLYIPKIFRGSVNQTTYEQIRDKDVFATVAQQMAPVLGMEFTDVAFFCTAMSQEQAYEGLKRLSESADTPKVPVPAAA